MDPVKIVVLLETPAAAERFLARAQDALPPGERIVRVEELRAASFALLTLPRDDAAELVAREPPTILPGGFTLLVSYLRVRDDAAVQVRVSDGEPSEEREITMASILA